MTSEELAADFAQNPTGSIVLKKQRRRTVQAKRRQEAQAIADSFVDKETWPDAVAEMKEDSYGRYVKVYVDGKTEPPEDN